MAIGSEAYTVGLCTLYFGIGINGDSSLDDMRDLGNIVAAEITPNVTYLDHFKSVEGIRRKDKTVAIMKSISIPFTFDEINEENIRDFMYAVSLGGYKYNALQTVNVPIEGRAVLRFKTSVGQSFEYVIPRCALRADGGLTFNVESWLQGKFSLEVLQAPSSVSSYPYGVIDTNLNASTLLSNCETSWSKLSTGEDINVSLDDTTKVYGTYSIKVTPATTWAYGSEGIHSANVLAFVTFDASDFKEKYPFMQLWVRASRDFAKGDAYVGLFCDATPSGYPKSYAKLPAQSNAQTWEKNLVPLSNIYNASMGEIKSVALIGGAALDVSTAASVQTIWLDHVVLTN